MERKSLRKIQGRGLSAVMGVFVFGLLVPTRVSAQSGEQVVEVVAGFIGLLLALGLLIALIFYLVSMYKALAACSPGNRSLPPGLVWLNLIPLFGSIWMFVTVVSVASSLRREHAERGIPGDSGHGFGPGLAFAICGALFDILALSLPSLQVRIALCGMLLLAMLVLWIIHWSAVTRSRRELERASRMTSTPGNQSRIDASAVQDAGDDEGSSQAAGPARPPPRTQPGSGASTGTIVGIVAGVVGLVVIGGIALFSLALLSNRGDRLKAVSLETDGLFVPDVVAVLHNTGKGGYFDFFVEAGGQKLCDGGRTFIASDERRTIRFSCPELGPHTGQYELRWMAR